MKKRVFLVSIIISLTMSIPAYAGTAHYYIAAIYNKIQIGRASCRERV